MPALSLRRATRSRAIAAPVDARARLAAEQCKRAAPCRMAHAHPLRVVRSTASLSLVDCVRGRARDRGERHRGRAATRAEPTTINRDAVSPLSARRARRAPGRCGPTALAGTLAVMPLSRIYTLRMLAILRVVDDRDC
jgi:hypothetical protein